MIDANDVLADPAGTLAQLVFGAQHPLGSSNAQLGSREARDGRPWAPHWYGAVERSTGFWTAETDPVELPHDAQLLADRCRPYYERLAAHRIKGGDK